MKRVIKEKLETNGVKSKDVDSKYFYGVTIDPYGRGYPLMGIIVRSGYGEDFAYNILTTARFTDANSLAKYSCGEYCNNPNIKNLKQLVETIIDDGGSVYQFYTLSECAKWLEEGT